MKILLITGPDITLKEPYSSGIEAFVVSLADRLVAGGHKVDVIAKDADDDVLFDVIKLDGGADSDDTEGAQLNAFEKLDIGSYDVIHHNLFIPELYKIAAGFDKPSVLTLHSPLDDERSSVYRTFAQKADVTFVAISDRMRTDWSKALSTDISVIHNGIDLDLWPIRLKAEHDYLLWSGRINTEKNVVAAISLAKHLGQPLKIAGSIVDQSYFDKCIQPMLDTDRTYVGHTSQEELSELARHATAFLATAQWEEPFGLAAIEMLASGVPVVGFETAIPSELRRGGVSVASASTDWHDLVAGLAQVSSASPRACRDFADEFSIDKMTAAYIKLYRTLAPGQ